MELWRLGAQSGTLTSPYRFHQLVALLFRISHPTSDPSPLPALSRPPPRPASRVLAGGALRRRQRPRLPRRTTATTPGLRRRAAAGRAGCARGGRPSPASPSARTRSRRCTPRRAQRGRAAEPSPPGRPPASRAGLARPPRAAQSGGQHIVRQQVGPAREHLRLKVSIHAARVLAELLPPRRAQESDEVATLPRGRSHLGRLVGECRRQPRERLAHNRHFQV